MGAATLSRGPCAMSQNLRSLTAEFVGTLLFVFVGAGSVVTTALAGPNAGAVTSLIVALAHGVGMAVIISATMNISRGQINPAVRRGLWIANKIDGRQASQYILAQLLGALVGAALVKGVLPRAAVSLALGGAPRLAGDVTFLQGVWIEAFLTFFLVSAVFGTAVSSQAPKIGGVGGGVPAFLGPPGRGGLNGGPVEPARALPAARVERHL